jgi:hypothetical protein
MFTPTLTIASAGVIGISAIVLIIVLGSLELYLTLNLFNRIYIRAAITSDTPSLLSHPFLLIYPGKKNTKSFRP